MVNLKGKILAYDTYVYLPSIGEAQAREIPLPIDMDFLRAMADRMGIPIIHVIEVDGATVAVEKNANGDYDTQLETVDNQEVAIQA